MGYSLWNNQIVKDEEVIINKEDRGYQFGDGVYEVVKVYNGKLFTLIEHIHRFYESANKIKLTIPYPKEQLIELLKELVEVNQVKDGYVYFQITRGTSPRNHLFPSADVLPVLTGNVVAAERPFGKFENGIKATFIEDMRWLRCDIKTLNLLGAVLAKQEAYEKGLDEAILHRDGIVTEASSSNVFGIRGNTLLTHPANNLILKGITRQVVIQCAHEIGMEIKEEPFSTEEVLKMDGLFVTSTNVEITPVVEIDGHQINSGKIIESIRLLQKQFNKKIESL